MRIMPALLGLGLFISGCAEYVTPGPGADLGRVGVTRAVREASTDGVIQKAFDKKPLASFPTSIAVVRLQAPGYTSETTKSYGTGAYSIVTTRDIEKPEQIDRLGRLPMVSGIAPLNRMLLKPDFESDVQLREAAAQLQADMLLIYTLDTSFTTEDKAAPLSVISLGLSPNQQVRVTCTASAVLMDTRNGYIYGLAEATDQQNQMTNAWQNDVAIDETRRATESAAFDKLVGDLEGTWKGVVARYATDAHASRE
ncbi:MAG TPA: hypothetical protein VHS31_12160 [Tepidisphaeraceae bacterium]|jgi:hypothetical protein|nr:hypothetical protein [Tepidisphaeraceae bacterium]